MALHAYGPDGRKDVLQAHVTEDRTAALNRMLLQVQIQVAAIEQANRQRLLYARINLWLTCLTLGLIVGLFIK